MLYRDVEPVIAAVDVKPDVAGPRGRPADIAVKIEAELAADDGGVVVLAVEVQLVEAVELPSPDKCVEGDLERFLGRFPRGVAAHPESDGIDALVDVAVLEVEAGIVLTVAFGMGEDPVERGGSDGDIDARQSGIVIDYPAVIGLAAEQGRQEQSETEQFFDQVLPLSVCAPGIEMGSSIYSPCKLTIQEAISKYEFAAGRLPAGESRSNRPGAGEPGV